MALRIKNKVKKTKENWEEAKCTQCEFFMYSDIDSIISGTKSPDEGFCGCETADLNGKEVRYDRNACPEFKPDKTILKAKQIIIDDFNNDIKDKTNCLSCAAFITPDNKFDEQGFKIDYGYCTEPTSDLFKKSILMEQKVCSKVS